MLVSTSFVYSFSAFKGDLLLDFGWDEVVAAYIFTFANFGQNFVVHMGIFYDYFGFTVASWVCASLKCLGNLGMWALVSLYGGAGRAGVGVAGAAGGARATSVVPGVGIPALDEFVLNNLPTIFGLCFFLDTQASGGAIILAAMESQKIAPVAIKGAIGSCMTGAFGFGATVWVGLYDHLFRPDVGFHFLASAVSSSRRRWGAFLAL